MFKIEFPPIQPLTFDSVGLTNDDLGLIKDACVLTCKMSELAASCVGGMNFTTEERKRITEWFGTSTAREVEPSVVQMNLFLQDEGKTVTFVDATLEKKAFDFMAYGIKEETGMKIHLGSKFFGNLVLREDRAHVIYHEITHKLLGTEDVLRGYGPSNCRELARKNHRQALKNADNWGYYAASFKWKVPSF